MAKTKKPSGLSLTRNGWNYTASWKIADDNYAAGQWFEWRYHWVDDWSVWRRVNVSATATSCTFNVYGCYSGAVGSGFYPDAPYFISFIEFRIYGRRQDTKDGVTTKLPWSDAATYRLQLNTPNTPTLTAEWDSTLTNQTRFEWNTETSQNDLKPYANVKWQSVLMIGCNTNNGANVDWRNLSGLSRAYWREGTGSMSGHVDIAEDTSIFTHGSFTRWFRVASQGPGYRDGRRGMSGWRYIKHVYATPYKPVISSVPVSKRGSVLNSVVRFTAKSSIDHPVDHVTIQYAISTPDAGMACPAGADWTDAVTITDPAADGVRANTSWGSNGNANGNAQFSLDEAPDLDKCLFFRVISVHDERISYSDVWRTKSISGKITSLTPPSGLTVQTNDQTYRATITATNNSAVPDSQLAIIYRPTNTKNSFVCGIIPHGQTSVTVQCPNWSGESAVAFGVYAFQGSATSKTRADGATAYSITPNAVSTEVWGGGAVPLAPTGVTANASDMAGEAILTWNWSWSAADTAEISWSDNANAWESTDEPDNYTISNLHAARWRVTGLATGKTWFFAVRLAKTNSDGDLTYGPYSAIVSLDMSAAPDKPVLTLSNAVIPPKGQITASWVYVSGDKTAQSAAEVCLATVNDGEVTYGRTVARTAGASSVTIGTRASTWVTGQEYSLCVRVTSESNRTSGWSDPVSFIIADPITCTIDDTSLVEREIVDEDQGNYIVNVLTEMPLTATILGAGAGGTTILAIERAEDYIVDRPDESQFNGYAGESIAFVKQMGESEITVDAVKLIGLLDDGAKYRLTATTQDSYGQSAEQSLEFIVDWTHQAIVPEATAVIDTDMTARLTPIAPSGALTDDVCDIYRLSADTPVLIVKDGEFGTEYVDPYPTIGSSGGYRFVYKTANGDYITSDNKFAWTDISVGLDMAATIIDFDDDQVVLQYNMEVSHAWTKDFTETTYLGGAVQGDWNLSTHRSVSLSADSVVIDDPDLINSMRRLAAYSGICHVRTVDGSTFTADVQVSEKRTYEQAGKVAAFSIAITQVDQQKLDGVTAEDWES